MVSQPVHLLIMHNQYTITPITNQQMNVNLEIQLDADFQLYVHCADPKVEVHP